MYLLKTNELAKDFVDQGGFELFHRYLNNECLKNHQIAYNVICSLWIISYHQFALRGFEDYRVIIIYCAKFILLAGNHWKSLKGTRLLQQGEDCQNYSFAFWCKKHDKSYYSIRTWKTTKFALKFFLTLTALTLLQNCKTDIGLTRILMTYWTSFLST